MQLYAFSLSMWNYFKDWRCPRKKECLQLLRRTQVQLSAPMWWLTTFCKSSSREPVPFSGLSNNRIHVMPVCPCRQNPHTKDKNNPFLKEGRCHDSVKCPTSPPTHTLACWNTFLDCVLFWEVKMPLGGEAWPAGMDTLLKAGIWSYSPP